MSEKVEGTIVLDGLIQGRLPPAADALVSLREWAGAARRVGLRFNLEVEGDQYNILPDNQPIAVASFGPRGVDLIVDTLQSLLDVYPPGAAGMVLSTVRSTEYRQNMEVQTLYAVGPDGRIHTREQVTPAKTVKPPSPMTGRDRLRLALTGLAAALLVFAISAFFVDYRGLVRGLYEHRPVFASDEITVDADRFAGFLTVAKVTPDSMKGEVVVKLERTAKFPLNDAALDKLADAPGQPTGGQAASATRPADSQPDGPLGRLGRRLAIDAIARGYVRCEMFDKDGKLIAATEERIAELRDKPAIELTLPLSRNPRLARIVLNY